ncbi:hypothetical protein GCM10010174_02460 [Kutzneria viridogrisea]|uniref:Uncharacterized protein n=2 Tax=Kutzneria TaxID=43356 RepID=W5WHM8_9PSEU|nr:hypothetical protein KALB_4287 [Kutzneria albida DSM 43870]MBA8924764.1 hypothetical protein [Kutzneria viridogrisea]
MKVPLRTSNAANGTFLTAPRLVLPCPAPRATKVPLLTLNVLNGTFMTLGPPHGRAERGNRRDGAAGAV